MKTGTLTKRKQYELNPHRHVKIWLSKDPDIFMNDLNQLRLVKMRANCPKDEINLIYDSQLLSKNSHFELLVFCCKQNLNAVDVRKIIPKCNQHSEQQLIKVYEDEISHLDAGGNLAAASDILRWIEPVFLLGTYSDFDVDVSTKGLPPIIPVLSEFLFNFGSVFSKDKYGVEQENLVPNNDVIAVLNPKSTRIKKVHQFIINACKPKFYAPMPLSRNLDYNFNQVDKDYNIYLTKLRNTYLGKTPREWRSNIHDFIQCLDELIKYGNKNSDRYSDNFVFSELLKLWNKYSGNISVLQHNLYLDSVVYSTGPTSLTSLLPRKKYKDLNHFIYAHSLSFYKPLFHAFNPPRALYWRMSLKDYKNRGKSDLSWLDGGLYNIINCENKLHFYAMKIQKTWRNSITAPKRRVTANNLHRIIKDRKPESVINRGNIDTISPMMHTKSTWFGDEDLHELHKPLAEYFKTSQGLVVFNYLIEDEDLEILLISFLNGEHLTQEPNYVKELTLIILKKIDLEFKKYTSTQVIDMTRILKSYNVCDRLNKLISYQKGMLTRNDKVLFSCITTILETPSESFDNPNDIVEYHRQNKTICIDCVDFYFNELESFSHEELISELTQTNISKIIAEKGNIYALYRYFEILKTLSESELSAVLMFKDKDEKTINYYLLEARYDYLGLLMKMYIKLLQKVVNPSLKSTLLQFKISKNDTLTLSTRLMYQCQNNAEALCAYLVLLGNDTLEEIHVDSFSYSYSKQLIFEYIMYMENSPKKNKLIDLALSTGSALNAFITYTQDYSLITFLKYPGFQHLHPYIWALSECKKPIEQQSNTLFSTTMRFFLPTPLNVPKVEGFEPSLSNW